MVCLLASGATAQKLEAVKEDSQINVTVDGKLFTSYLFKAAEKYPFFFPVNGPSGLPVTSMRNPNFPHHSSLFFGCDQVNGGNYWQEGLNKGQIVSEGPVIVEASGKRVVIAEVCNWKRPGAPQPLRDSRRIEISAPSDALRQIDFEIVLEAVEDVKIGKTNHSLFSGRMHPELTVTNGGFMVNAGGGSAEKGTFGKPAPWMACYGKRASSGVREGMAILQHPSNPWYPAPWFTRDYGFFSPTPMYWPADGKATRIAKGEKVTLRYRVLVFSGDPEEAGVGKAFAAYADGARHEP
jgi:hypothetical protein